MTGAAVDLAAVRVARDQLAAIVAAHPELTGARARARLAEHLPEIIAMKPLDPNATGAARTITVRLSADLIARLETERDRLAALVPGASLGLSDAVRSFILRAVATPSTIAPAAPAAPAPSRPVASPAAPVEAPPVAPAAAPVDPRQLPLLAPVAPLIALHRTADGSSAATITGNDNAVSAATSTPKPKRAPATSPAAPVDAAAVGARLRALRDDEVARGVPKGSREWSLRTAGERAGVAPPTIDKLMKGERVGAEYVAKVAAILPAE